MSEKRFTVDDDGIYDNQEKKHFKFIAYDWIDCDIYECCEKLNEQQEIINKRLDQIIELQDKYRILEFNHSRLEKRNKAQYEKIGEQQDLIEELYDFRLTYNALLFNEWAEDQKYEVYKSRRHGDGELCFDGEYFIVVAQLPTGQVTNHYHIRYWDMFKINEYEKVNEDFDGHTPSDVIERLQQVIDDERY